MIDLKDIFRGLGVLIVTWILIREFIFKCSPFIKPKNKQLAFQTESLNAILLIFTISIFGIAVLLPYYSAFQISWDPSFVLDLMTKCNVYLLFGSMTAAAFFVDFIFVSSKNNHGKNNNNYALSPHLTTKPLLLAGIVVFGLIWACLLFDNSIISLINKKYFGAIILAGYIWLFFRLIYLGWFYKWTANNTIIIKYFLTAISFAIAYLYFVFFEKRLDPSGLDKWKDLIPFHLIWLAPFIALYFANKLAIKTGNNTRDVPTLYYYAANGMLINFVVIFISDKNSWHASPYKAALSMMIILGITFLITLFACHKYKESLIL